MKFQSVAVFAALLFFSLESRAQTTAFTYQGQLSSNNVPANGLYDLRFRLFDVSSNVVSSPITNSPTGVTNGQFIVTLDFGASVFDGSDRWLQIAVRNYGSASDYTPLSPLQQITSTPYAIRAFNAANASNAVSLTAPLQGTNITGIVPVANLPVNVAFLNSNQTFTGANVFSGAVTANNSANTFSGAFTGNGANLTNIPATVLTGILPDARLSANVALQSNTVINFAGSVGASNFVGAGHGLTNVPGAFFWVVPTNGLMYPNVGYICTNDFSPVTMTLPPTNSVSIGDTFKVCGVGGAGWIIAQTNGETISAGNLSGSIGQNWKSNGLSAHWSAIAGSADGTKLAAVVNPGNIYVSTNSGATWTQQASSLGSLYWSAIASSSDGSKLVATVGYSIYANTTGSIYTNSGSTWKAVGITAGLGWSCVASSADGTKLVAAVRNSSNGGIYTSPDSGKTWNPVSGTGTLLWSGVACSSDGSKIVGVDANGNIYTTNNGVKIPFGYQDFTAVTSSSDGERLVATTSGGAIYVSTDAGANWSKISSTVVSGDLTSVASSADGSRLVAAAGGLSTSGNIFGSSDSGGAWSQFVGAPTLSWAGIASSADGSFLAAAVNGGGIYISSQTATTTGKTGYLSGAQHSAIELIYTGNGNFLPLNHEGTIRAY